MLITVGLVDVQWLWQNRFGFEINIQKSVISAAHSQTCYKYNKKDSQSGSNSAILENIKSFSFLTVCSIGLQTTDYIGGKFSFKRGRRADCPFGAHHPLRADHPFGVDPKKSEDKDYKIVILGRSNPLK